MTDTSDVPAAEARGLSESEREAVDVALNFLSYRPRTRREVQRKLSERGYGEETVEAALRRLASVGLVDDEAFVGAYVRDRVAHRPMGVRRMVQELYLKGIPREASLPVITAVLAEEETDERAMAERVVARKQRAQRQRPIDARRRKRLVGQLIRRGFDVRVAREAVDAELASSTGQGGEVGEGGEGGDERAER